MNPARTRPARAVFFDVGGTLLDTNSMLDAALLTALAPIDPERTIGEVRRAVAQTAADMPVRRPPFTRVEANVSWWIERYRRVGGALGLAGGQLETFVETAWRAHSTGDNLCVVTDAPEALGRLRTAGFRLGVISNWDDSLEDILARKGLAGWFDVVLASTLVGVAKPDRGIFELALARVALPADEAWHVGDDPDADALGARAAGLGAVLLDPFNLYAQLEARGVLRAFTLTGAVDRILADDGRRP